MDKIEEVIQRMFVMENGFPQFSVTPDEVREALVETYNRAIEDVINAAGYHDSVVEELESLKIK
jgi:hypothetical protein